MRGGSGFAGFAGPLDNRDVRGDMMRQVPSELPNHQRANAIISAIRIADADDKQPVDSGSPGLLLHPGVRLFMSDAPPA